MAPAREASAASLNGLLPYNANVSLVSQSTIDEIEDLVKQEVISSLYRAHLGLSPNYPASSCKQLAEKRPDYVSGYYWVTGDAGPTGVYCELAGGDVFGKDWGWTRIGHVDMTDGRTECPPRAGIRQAWGQRSVSATTYTGAWVFIHNLFNSRHQLLQGVWEGHWIPVLQTQWIRTTP